MKDVSVYFNIENLYNSLTKKTKNYEINKDYIFFCCKKK